MGFTCRLYARPLAPNGYAGCRPLVLLMTRPIVAAQSYNDGPIECWLDSEHSRPNASGGFSRRLLPALTGHDATV